MGDKRKMTEEEIENYFVESAGYGRDKVRNFMDIVNKALKQKGERIADLEKENAELKGLVNQYKASKCGSISLVNRNMIMFDQLTKAKDLLKQWLQTSKASGCDDINIVTDTEQFLSEVEK